MAGASDTLINTLFDGRYRIVRKLGAGGMANVYLAEDEDLGRRVAIKILNDRYANDEAFIERFRREAKSAAGLSHPNIVSIYDRGEAEGTYYIAMEVIEGRSLKELILTRGALPIATSLGFAKQLLEALRFAHRHGIIHRDIKPHNVLVSTDERAKRHETRLKVTDFGIARHGASQMTEAGSIMGTAQYLSPAARPRYCPRRRRRRPALHRPVPARRAPRRRGTRPTTATTRDPRAGAASSPGCSWRSCWPPPGSRAGTSTTRSRTSSAPPSPSASPTSSASGRSSRWPSSRRASWRPTSRDSRTARSRPASSSSRTRGRGAVSRRA